MELAFGIMRYAVTGVSYLVSNLSKNELKRIRSVILFGSVARGTASRKSDVDIFFHTDASRSVQKALRARLNKLAGSFYLSNQALEFKLKGIDNELNITVGRLDEWPDLSQSMASNGISLYGKYMSRPSGLKAYTIFSWEKPGKYKGALLNKLYGYRAGKKRYSGLLQRTGSIKLGRASIMVPASFRDSFVEVFEQYKVNYSRYDIWA